MTKLDYRQEIDLALVAAADMRLRDAKAIVNATVRAEVKVRLEHLIQERDEAVLLADEHGVPRVQIARVGMHVDRTVDVREAIARAQTRRRERHEIGPQLFSRGTSETEIVVTLSGDLLDAACRATSWVTQDAIKAGVTSATFEVVAAQHGENASALKSHTPSFIPKLQLPHPVVSWTRSNSARALAWWKEQA